MYSSLRWLLAAGLLTAGLALTVTPVFATKVPPPAHSGVIDNAKLFSEDAVKKARERVVQIQKDYGKGLFIETIAKAESPDAVDRMAADKYKERDVGGIYVLICKEPRRIRVQVGDKTRQRAFTRANQDRLVAIFTENFKAKKFDEGLDKAITYVDETLDKTIGKGKGDTAGAVAPGGESTKNKPASNINPIWGWICIGLVVILAIWLVIGLIRAFTRPAAPAGGPAYAGAGGGGGGGGGGFFSSMLGGLFGAAAGMYLYDSFFRSHTPPTGGSAYGSEPTGGVDDTGSTGAGGDYGGDAADAGGAGGDWGGGDAGGAGGDWGGGDAGGAGGDWGGGDAGGAGGDWGVGGGGDWGGGGGGGDW